MARPLKRAPFPVAQQRRVAALPTSLRYKPGAVWEGLIGGGLVDLVRTRLRLRTQIAPPSEVACDDRWRCSERSTALVSRVRCHAGGCCWFSCRRWRWPHAAEREEGPRFCLFAEPRASGRCPRGCACAMSRMLREFAASSSRARSRSRSGRAVRGSPNDPHQGDLPAGRTGWRRRQDSWCRAALWPADRHPAVVLRLDQQRDQRGLHPLGVRSHSGVGNPALGVRPRELGGPTAEAPRRPGERTGLRRALDQHLAVS